ncbi:DMT family transporter [Frisingicoccus sp.]|uniref:DMT family transporter n=1 Tax=Frisingicoccus sp. TaxID=1918627 RepID=UPI002E78244F|nr:DMT family transporter [Frisingicoccus sp.]MEE0752726.1 DMT family transporter [Frisingicoccus sp.]
MKKLVIVLGTVSISLSAIFARMASAPSIILVFYRMLFACVLLLSVVFVKCRDELKRLQRKDIFLCACSGLFLGMHFTLYFESLKYTSIAASVVLVNLEVFFVALFLFFMYREKIPVKGILGIGAAFLGTVLIAVTDMGSGSNVVFGDILAFGGSFCVAVYTLIGRSCRTHISTSVYTCFVYGFACLTVGIAALISGTPFSGYEPVNYGLALGMTIFCTFFGHSVYSWGLKYLNASYITTIKLLEPVFASILGLLIFREIPGAFVIIGGAVVIGGIIYYTRNAESA